MSDICSLPFPPTIAADTTSRRGAKIQAPAQNDERRNVPQIRINYSIVGELLRSLPFTLSTLREKLVERQFPKKNTEMQTREDLQEHSHLVYSLNLWSAVLFY